jgi:hypothetical protein
MAYDKSKLLAGLNALAQEPQNAAAKGEAKQPLIDLMADPSYLRHSSALINEALQKGFDVLQLANGDIVTTTTKTVIHTYRWDTGKGALARVKQPGAPSRRRRRKGELIEDDE